MTLPIPGSGVRSPLEGNKFSRQTPECLSVSAGTFVKASKRMRQRRSRGLGSNSRSVRIFLLRPFSASSYSSSPAFFLSSPSPLLIPRQMLVYTDAFDSVDMEPRPPKRPRPLKDADDPHRTYTMPVPGPSGLQAEGDANAEGTTKKARKRPLSCGECRRSVSVLVPFHVSLTSCCGQAKAQGK